GDVLGSPDLGLDAALAGYRQHVWRRVDAGVHAERPAEAACPHADLQPAPLPRDEPPQHFKLGLVGAFVLIVPAVVFLDVLVEYRYSFVHTGPFDDGV